MKAFAAWIVEKVWDGTNLFTKILMLWAFGPAFLVYMALGYKAEFKQEILAEATQERTQWAAPLIAQREEQMKNIDKNIVEIKNDVRDMRNFLIGIKK